MFKAFVLRFLIGASLLNIGSAKVYDKFIGYYDDMYIVKENEEIMVDKENNYVMPFDFQNIDLMTDNSYYFDYNNATYLNNPTKLTDGFLYNKNTSYNRGLIIEKKDGLYGVSDYKGNTVIPFLYDKINISGEAYQCIQEDTVKVISRANEVIKTYKYKKSIISEKDGKFALVNSDNEIIIPYADGELKFISDSYIRRGNEIGFTPNELYDINGNIIVSKEDNFSVFAAYGDEFSVMNLSNYKFGVINCRKEILIPFEYDLLYRPQADEDLYYVKKNGKNGIISGGKETIINFDFTVEKVYDGFVFARKEDSCDWVVMSDKGIPYLYTEAKDICYDYSMLVIITKDDKCILTTLNK